MKAEYLADVKHSKHVVAPPNPLTSNQHHNGYCTGTAANLLFLVVLCLFAGLVNFLINVP